MVDNYSGAVTRDRYGSRGRRGPTRRTGSIIATAITIAAASGGCGSYTKHDFIARADAICANALRATRSIALGGTAAATQDPAALAAYLRRALPIIHTEATQLHALRRPSDTARDHALLTRYLQAVTETAAAYRRLAVAAQHRDPQAVANAGAALRSNPGAALASRYGLRTCGASGATVG
jgi:hypothetical protein